MSTNKQIAEIFYQMAEILELGDQVWEARAYQKAARAIENFSKDSRKKDGLRCYCRACQAIWTKQYNKTHRKEKSLWMQKWRESDRKRAYEVRRKQRENPIAQARRKELDNQNRDKINKRQRASLDAPSLRWLRDQDSNLEPSR